MYRHSNLKNMIEIKITTESVAEMHKELQELLFGAKTTNQLDIPVLTTNQLDIPVLTPEPVAVQPEVEEEQAPKKPVKRRTKTVKAEETPVQEEATKEEAPAPVKEKEAPAEEKAPAPTEAEEEEAPAEDGDDIFAGKTDAEVLNILRAKVTEFNAADPGNVAKSKKIFMEYKVATVLKLSRSQAIDFYNKLSAE